MKKNGLRLKSNKAGFCFSSFLSPCTLFIVLMFLSANVFGQGTRTISGKITDLSGLPLPGATIVEEGTTNGAVTNPDGTYVINVSENASLVFSFIGMTPKTIKVGRENRIDVQLEEGTIGIDEVVAVAYGTQTRSTMTSAIGSVKAKAIENIPTTTVSSKLQGKLAGVAISTISGRPGNELQIRIRGGSSINKSNSPLVLIDGFERALSDINSNDIESISVLKDAAATAMYGSRASNGIILVTTKRGQEGKPQLVFDFSWGLQQFNRQYDLLSAEQWLQWWRPRIVTSRYKYTGGWITGAQPSGTGNGDDSTWTTRILGEGETVPEGWKTMIDPVTGETLVFQDNNLQDILYRNAIQKNYNLSATGGNKDIKYAVGIGYNDQDGVAIGTNYKRVNGRVNLDFNLSNKLSMSTYTDFSFSTTNKFTDEGDIFTRGTLNAPTIRLRFDDGTPGWGTNATLANPLYVVETRDAKSQRALGNVGANIRWQIAEGLELSGNTFVQMVLGTYDYFEKAHHFNELRTAQADRNISAQRQSELILKYNKVFAEKHHLDLLGVVSDLQYISNNASMEANGGATDKITTLNAAPTKVEASTTYTEERLISQLFKAEYNYDYKYIVSGSVRRDGSSKFGSGNRFGYFPSASVGWVVSKEDFFPEGTFVKFMKLRATYGVTGNDDIDRYVAQGTYQAGYSYGGHAATSATAMPNKALTWERTKQVDLALDLGLFNQRRLELSVDVYQRRTEDLLFTVQLPRESGFSTVQQNVGTVDYKGIEIEVTSHNITTSDFSWTTLFNFAYNINKVIKLPYLEGVDKNRINGTVLPDGTGYGGIAEGERMGSITGYKVAYLIDTDEQAALAMYDESAYGYDPKTGDRIGLGVKFAGDFEWVDRDDNQQITSLDQFVLGYKDPTITGGLTNTFGYKGFTLNIFMDYAMGHSVQDMVQSWMDGNKTQRVATTTAVLDAWQRPGDAARTNQPRSEFHDQNHQANLRTSDFYTYKGDYLCLRNVSLSYNVPATMLKNKVQKLEMYVTASNIFYLTEYKGPNPERGGSIGHQDGYYPPFRTFMAGIKIGL